MDLDGGTAPAHDDCWRPSTAVAALEGGGLCFQDEF